MTRILRHGEPMLDSQLETSVPAEPPEASVSPEPRSNGAAVANSSPTLGPPPKELEYYSGLYRQLAARGNDCDCLSVGVTSCSRHAGVTTIAMNLAAAAAREIRGDVLLVDANFESPCAGDAVSSRQGLADLLTNVDVDWRELVHRVRPQLDVLSAGDTGAREQLTVYRPSFCRLLDDLEQHYELIIFDLPLANDVSACYPLGRELHGVLLVVEAERTRNQAAARATKQLREAEVPMVGAVFNKRRKHVPDWIYRRI